MSPNTVLSANAALLEMADRLAAEFDGIAAGSVLRCCSRAVLLARRAGTPLDSLPIVAEDSARRMLANRGLGRVLIEA